MIGLAVLCPHGLWSKHGWSDVPFDDQNAFTCPGGRPATVEEVVEWLVQRGEWPHGIAAVPIGRTEDV